MVKSYQPLNIFCFQLVSSRSGGCKNHLKVPSNVKERKNWLTSHIWAYFIHPCFNKCTRADNLKYSQPSIYIQPYCAHQVIQTFKKGIRTSRGDCTVYTQIYIQSYKSHWRIITKWVADAIVSGNQLLTIGDHSSSLAPC